MTQNEPIIFIHGLFQASFAEDPAHVLSPNPVAVPDLPGYGTHRRPQSEISIDAAADHIYSLIHSLGHERAHLVGHSVGGAIAVVLANRYPEAVASLISVEGNFTLKDAFWSQYFARIDERKAEEILAGYRADPRDWLESSGITAPTLNQLTLAEQSLYAQPASTLQAISRSVVQVTGDPSYLKAIVNILDRPIPFHLVAGERSRVGWDVPEWVLRRVGNVIIQPNAGHMMLLEDEAQFLSIIRQIITNDY